MAVFVTDLILQDKLLAPNHHGYGSTRGNGIPPDSHIVDMSMSKSMEKGSTVSFHGINYEVETKIDRVKTTKCILKDIK